VRIGLDMDGVVVDSIPRWIEVINRGSGRYYGPGELPATHDTPAMAAYSDQNELEMLILPPPTAGAAEALAALRREGHELVVVTARSPRLRGLTEAWLAYHGMAVDRLYFLEGGSKAPVALQEGLDLLVEDAPHNALAVAAAGVPVLLYGAPYNAQVTHPLVTRCQTGWPDVLTHIQTISRQTA
jgi:uncharacterized protein